MTQRMVAIEDIILALKSRHQFTVQAPCPDGLGGCCVMHLRTEERVPMTREECIEVIEGIARATPLPAGGGG